MECQNIRVNNSIIDRITNYLNNGLLLKQNIISSRYPENRKIDFIQFMNRLSLLRVGIKLSEENNIIEWQAYSKKYRDTIDYYKDSVVISPKEINELLSYVKLSLKDNGVQSHVTYNENSFLCITLENLLKEMNRNFHTSRVFNYSEYDNVKRWFYFFKLSKTQGFEKNCMGKFSFDNFGLKIMDKYDQVIDEETVSPDKVIKSSNLYIGTLKNNESYEYACFLEREVFGITRMQNILMDNRLYPLEDDCPLRDGHCYVSSPILLFDFLALENLNHLKRFVYHKQELENIMVLYEAISNLDNLDKNRLEKTIEVAVLWWIKAICYINDFESVGVGVFSKYFLTHLYRQGVKTTPREKLEQLRIDLKGRIKEELLKEDSLCLSRNSPLLQESVRLAHLEYVNIPENYNMRIEKNQIVLFSGNNREILYNVLPRQKVKK